MKQQLAIVDTPSSGSNLDSLVQELKSETQAEVRGRPAQSRAWLAVLDELERARVADGQVTVGAWADHHHDAGGRVGAAGGGLSGSERDRSATLRLVRRGLAHDAEGPKSSCTH